MSNSPSGLVRIALAAESLDVLIHVIRGRRVMFDADLATLYDVPTKAVNQALRRNADRFPEDFAFQLSKEELANWRSRIVTSNSSAKMGLRLAALQIRSA